MEDKQHLWLNEVDLGNAGEQPNRNSSADWCGHGGECKSSLPILSLFENALCYFITACFKQYLPCSDVVMLKSDVQAKKPCNEAGKFYLALL